MFNQIHNYSEIRDCIIFKNILPLRVTYVESELMEYNLESEVELSHKRILTFRRIRKYRKTMMRSILN